MNTTLKWEKEQFSTGCYQYGSNGTGARERHIRHMLDVTAAFDAALHQQHNLLMQYDAAVYGRNLDFDMLVDNA